MEPVRIENRHIQKALQAGQLKCYSAVHYKVSTAHTPKPGTAMHHHFYSAQYDGYAVMLQHCLRRQCLSYRQQTSDVITDSENLIPA